MAPASEPGTPPGHLPSLWHLIDSLFKHPGLLFGASTIILGIFAASRLKHSTRCRHEQRDLLLPGSTPSDEKHDYDYLSLSDLPPPLRSVLTHDTLVEGLSQSQQQLIPSDPLPYQRQNVPSDPALSSTSPSKPWRRHSCSSRLSTDLPTTEVRSDKTSYHPIIDDNGNRQPGRWRRRTLIFEMLPAADHGHDTPTASAPIPHNLLNGIDARASLKTDSDDADLAAGSSTKP